MLRFADFITFDMAARAVFNDPTSQQRCRAWFTKLSETARRHPGSFMVEGTPVRKGVAFKSKPLDDQEHAVFAQRLANRLPTKSVGGNYGDFLHQSVRAQGDALGDMQWDAWEITQKILELGGINPNVMVDPKTTPAQRHALVGKINWAAVTLPRLKAKLGPSFKVDDAWKRELGIARLKKIKAAVEAGQQIADPQEQRLLGIWKTLEVQLGSDILPAGPKSDVGMTQLPMKPSDRKRFYRSLTGTNEAVANERPLQLSPQSAYDHLTQYGVDVITDEEAKDLYLTRILQDLKNGNAFIPSSTQGSEADRKRWRDSAARSWGGFLPAARNYDPGNAPGFAQWAAGMTTTGFKSRTNPSGRRVPFAYNEPEEMQRAGDVPGIQYVIDAPSQEVPNKEVNAYYRSGTPEANDAVEKELMKPARDAILWLQKKGWVKDPARIDDYTQQIVMGMLNRTGSVENWRSNVGFRRATASMLARRFASQGWPSEAKQRTGQYASLDTATGAAHSGGEDEISRVQGGVAKARAAIQKAIANMLDIDTTSMGADEDRFVYAVDTLNDPKRAGKALEILDQLSARHAAALPQVRHAVARIQRHLEPLMTKMRVGG